MIPSQHNLKFNDNTDSLTVEKITGWSHAHRDQFPPGSLYTRLWTCIRKVMLF